jgi:lipopolysaccharide/colanic/teichoic acid biosynthesis glycosyltransferase
MNPPPDALSSSGPAASRSVRLAQADAGRLTSPSPLAPLARVHAVPVCNVVASSGRLTEMVYRGLEIFVAAIGLALAMPLMLIVAMLIRWDSPGPALFFHQRPGRSIIIRGRELQQRRDLLPPPSGCEPENLYLVPSYFHLPKFRTMYVDARTRFPEYYAYKFPSGEFHRQYPTNRYDPRLTRVGRVLRKLSIDELPNLWCVLSGRIRLVGPRPEAPEVLQYYAPEEMYKFACKPGISGLAQINGRGLLNWGETLAWDLEYVRTRSVWLDLKIIAITLKHVVSRHGAF